MIDRITFERVYIASIEQSNAVNAAADNDVKRADMAEFYRDCIIADTLAAQFKPPGTSRVDFRLVNAAILARWPKGLTWIKTRAWKLLEAR